MPGVIDTNLYRNLRRVFLGSEAWGTLRNRLRQYWVTPPRGVQIRWDAADINGGMTWRVMPEGREYWSQLFELQNHLTLALQTEDRAALQRLRARIVEPPSDEAIERQAAEAARADAEFREQLQRDAERRRATLEQRDAERMKKYAKVYD